MAAPPRGKGRGEGKPLLAAVVGKGGEEKGIAWLGLGRGGEKGRKKTVAVVNSRPSILHPSLDRKKKKGESPMRIERGTTAQSWAVL